MFLKILLIDVTVFYLTFSFTSFKMEFKPLPVSLAAVAKQFQIANNILKATALTCFSFNEGKEEVPQFYFFCYTARSIIPGVYQ